MKKWILILAAVLSLFTFSMGASAKTTGNLTTSKALNLALEARKHYWSAMSGHNPEAENAKCTDGSFDYKGTDYRYFCSDLGTKKKFTKYMNKVFTRNAIKKGIKKYSFIEYKGKFAQPNADGGSLLEWDKAKGKLIYQRKDIRLYEFTVPVGETKEVSKEKVTFVKVNGEWLINAIDAVR
ncbi:IseA DL-endopeptidase inhibitor family protein [Falsibacillus pallidus]|uniref:IseA-like putative DL-endopeptidase inhibitor n=1 Tax=Falsibacillus pallidus TaxID=493781 RepID=A0A370G631_9BACI|nr:IseA DL-endopeptidase inhibitor family protein [Falsibacillus pallidus]RDI38516.1 IseA-like putative DL-endopeptidase inhibitor [Falsibacillus pallidus]